jgi:hypothetical protein
MKHENKMGRNKWTFIKQFQNYIFFMHWHYTLIANYNWSVTTVYIAKWINPNLWTTATHNTNTEIFGIIYQSILYLRHNI